jgi:hypothetical protein
MPSSRLLVRGLLPLPLVASLMLPSPPNSSRQGWDPPFDLLVLTSRDTGRVGLVSYVGRYPVLG